MIPPILHQTWKDQAVPAGFRRYVRSWKRLHPNWQFKLWSDADLEEFVQSHYPGYRDLFHSYPLPIMRADLGRYLVLREFGGVYADLDVEAVASLEPLLDATDPIFAYEPPSHAGLEFVQSRGFTRIVSNAVILTPRAHPFWDDFLNLLSRCRSAANPLDATGPFILTAACEQAGDVVRILPAHVFSPRDKDGVPVDRPESAAPTLAIHQWAGTWWRPPSVSLHRTLIPQLPSSRTLAWLKSKLKWPSPTSGHAGNVAGTEAFRTEFVTAESDASGFRDKINLATLGSVAQKGRHILIAIPLRDAAETIDRLLDRILALRYPPTDLSLAFLEGDSIDDTFRRIQTFARLHADLFRNISVIKRDSGVAAAQPRWAPELQRARRGHIARVRNMLIRESLGDSDWVVWIDADIVDFPDDVLTTLLSAGARIAHPNAVRVAGGESMDQNAWKIERQVSPEQMAPHISDGLYQPPKGFQRLYLSDLRYKDVVALDSVGGTMLLVDADLHRAGLTFPETPYRFLIETEAFGAVARDMGIVPIGLPNVEVVHAAR